MESAALIGGLTSVGGAAGALTGGLLAWRAFDTARLISSTPSTPVGELDEGLHEVKGTLGADEAVEAPLSRRACVYYRILVEQRRRNKWEALVDRKRSAPAWLDDGSGRVRVDVAAAQVVVSSPARVRSGIFGVPSAELDELLARLGEKPAEITGPFLRYREEVLEVGDRLYAVATAARGENGWEMRAENDVFVLSDRDESEVVRHQQRSGRRWLGLVAGGLVFAAFGSWLLLDVGGT